MHDREQLNSLLKLCLPLHPTSGRHVSKLVRFEQAALRSNRPGAQMSSTDALPAPGDVQATPASNSLGDEDALQDGDDMELDYMAAAIAHPGPNAVAFDTAAAANRVPCGVPAQHVAAHRTFKAVIRHTEAMEAAFQVTLSDEYPEVLPCWRLVSVTSQAKSTSATTRKAAALPRAQLATSAGELAAEV